ncbi:N-acetylmuramoyl-L-alanine amidase [Hasllibacter halocynthiae]|uniref:N-acetylmuramoyl-L-alanine amidase n=1 Tax=Hasllibacter halocynthiae TaxID=595589 RepID=A0A2T0X7S2_9RHOB|nr:N-acetylmuramoyl-L-alanine amidase [Hasllibacter halocynthiae]PRY94945.1 N-acetylmuramoyl-L-alanine amidase [Hasllibacter halocynthiae]
MKALLAAALPLLLATAPAAAEEGPARAAIVPEVTVAADAGRAARVELGLSDAVPWRLRLLDGPPRLALDLRDADLSALAPSSLTRARAIEAVRAVRAPGGWARLEMRLARPMRIARAGMTVGDEDEDVGAVLVLRLEEVDAGRFAGLAHEEEGAEASAPAPRTPRIRPVIVIDAGHGGIDPGAVAGGRREADIVLAYARALKEQLLRSGRFEVVMTRETDDFVPLRDRVAVAVAADADAFLSLHADSLGEGAARGGRVFTFDAGRQSEATARLVERHQRDSLVGDLDLTETDDAVTTVLVDLASARARPRSERLGDALLIGMEEAGVGLYRAAPRARGDFAVLRAAGVPAALVEVGFLTGDGPEALADPDTVRRMARGLLEGLILWSADDAARAGREMR